MPAKLPKLSRADIIRELLLGKLTVEEAADVAKQSPETIEAWRRKFIEAGTRDIAQAEVLTADLSAWVAEQILLLERAHIDLDQALTNTLGSLGELLEVDSVTIYQKGSSATPYILAYSWTSEPLQDSNPPQRSLEKSPAIENSLQHQGYFSEANLSEANAELRTQIYSYSTHSIQSLLELAIKQGDQIVGVLSIQDHQRTNYWTQEQICSLKILSAALTHKISEQRSHSKTEGEARFRNFIEQNSDAIWSIEFTNPIDINLPANEQAEALLQGRFAMANLSAIHFLGAKSQLELLGRTFREVLETLVGEEGIQRMLPAVVAFIGRNYRIHLAEVPEYRQSGKELWTSRTMHGVVYNQRLVRVWITARDITHNKKSDIEKQRLEKRLRQAERMESVGQLAGGIAHDFNNLLLAILGYSNLASSEPENTSQTIECLAEISRAGKRAAELTNQLLAFSRRQTMQKRVFDPVALVQSISNMLRRLLPETIELDIGQGAQLGLVNGDAGQLEQVIVNLCVNARDAMPRGGKLKLTTRNVVLNEEYGKDSSSSVRPGRYVLLSVSDTGVGIAPENLDRIFDPFFTTKSQGEGTGLGLATVYGIVRQHDGLVNVSSEPNRGTEFKIYLPVVDQATLDKPAREKEAAGGRETILIAEDEEQVRNLLVRILKRAGYSVVIAKDGHEAVQQYSEHASTIDLVILDVVMPGLSGREVQQRIKDIRPSAEVLFSSGYAGGVLDDAFFSRPENQVLVKPFDPNTLLGQVRKSIDKSSGLA